MTAKKKPAKKAENNSKAKNPNTKHASIMDLFSYFTFGTKLSLTNNPHIEDEVSKYIIIDQDADLQRFNNVDQAVEQLVQDSNIDTVLDALPGFTTEEDLVHFSEIIKQVVDLPKVLSYSEIFWFFVSTDDVGNQLEIIRGNEDNKLTEKAGKKVHSLAVTHLKDYYEACTRRLTFERKDYAEQLSRIEDSERAQLKNLLKKYYPDLVKNICG